MARSDLEKVAIHLVLGTVALACSVVMAAEKVKIEGLIITAHEDQITVRFGSGAEIDFVLTDNTQVSGIGRLSGPGKMEVAKATLIPGLKVQVEGNYNEVRQIVATSVKFDHDDLERAQAAQAATHEVKVHNQQQQEELERQNAELKAQNQALQQQQTELGEHQQQISANTARFGQIHDYIILEELTIYFGNGKVNVEPQYVAKLLALAEKAKQIDGYVITVRGYASSVGSASSNQKLSEQRANNVSNILLQRAHIPLMRMRAPGALGESEQLGSGKDSQGEAENRRVLVRLLQNKAVAGSQDTTN